MGVNSISIHVPFNEIGANEYITFMHAYRPCTWGWRPISRRGRVGVAGRRRACRRRVAVRHLPCAEHHLPGRLGRRRRRQRPEALPRQLNHCCFQQLAVRRLYLARHCMLPYPPISILAASRAALLIPLPSACPPQLLGNCIAILPHPGSATCTQATAVKHCRVSMVTKTGASTAGRRTRRGVAGGRRVAGGRWVTGGRGVSTCSTSRGAAVSTARASQTTEESRDGHYEKEKPRRRITLCPMPSLASPSRTVGQQQAST